MIFYDIAIYLYTIGIAFAAIFNKKARQMIKGRWNTYRILRKEIKKDEKYIWFHAASLGEFEQGRPLIERVRQHHPEYKILLTFFSPSGYEVRKNYKGADVVCYLPFDTRGNVYSFMRLAHPQMAIFIKYEFWSNILKLAHKRRIPIYSVSSIFRSHQIFFRWYGYDYRRVLKCFTHFFVQNEESKQLLASLGLKNATVTGDTRFDRVLDIQRQAKSLPLVEAFCGKSHAFVAGSSWAPDEDIFIRYFNQRQDIKLIIAPHVIDESHLKEIEGKLKMKSVRYTQATMDNVKDANCLIIDCFGLLSSIYRYGQVAYVGGGFGVGIHNVPEAAVYGIPVFIGPNNARFQEAQDLKRLGACLEIHSYDEFEPLVERLFSDREYLTFCANAASQYIHKNAGAADTIYEMLDFSKIR